MEGVKCPICELLTEYGHSFRAPPIKILLDAKRIMVERRKERYAKSITKLWSIDYDTSNWVSETWAEYVKKVTERALMLRRSTQLKLEGEVLACSEHRSSYTSPPMERISTRLTKRRTCLQLEGELNFIPEYRDKFIKLPIQKRAASRPTSGFRSIILSDQVPNGVNDISTKSNGITTSIPEYKDKFVELPLLKRITSRPPSGLRSLLSNGTLVDYKANAVKPKRLESRAPLGYANKDTFVITEALPEISKRKSAVSLREHISEKPIKFSSRRRSRTVPRVREIEKTSLKKLSGLDNSLTKSTSHPALHEDTSQPSKPRNLTVKINVVTKDNDHSTNNVNFDDGEVLPLQRQSRRISVIARGKAEKPPFRMVVNGNLSPWKTSEQGRGRSASPARLRWRLRAERAESPAFILLERTP